MSGIRLATVRAAVYVMFLYSDCFSVSEVPNGKVSKLGVVQRPCQEVQGPRPVTLTKSLFPRFTSGSIY
jgi:hypothetical protein